MEGDVIGCLIACEEYLDTAIEVEIWNLALEINPYSDIVMVGYKGFWKSIVNRSIL